MSKRTLYAFIISFVLLIAVIVLNKLSFDAMRSYSDRVDHTRQVISLFESVSSHLKSAQIYTPTYLNIPEKEFYILYRRETEGIKSELKRLDQFVLDNVEQKKLVDSLNLMIDAQLNVLRSKNIAEIIEAGEGWRLNSLLAI